MFQSVFTLVMSNLTAILCVDGELCGSIVNLKLLMPSTGYLRDLHIMETLLHHP